jgi:hypothetical protein
VVVSDRQIGSGGLQHADGSPKYPIVISLAAEAVADEQVALLRDYVSAGGFLFVGSSSFTRRPDGASRGDFALAKEMGLKMENSSLENWYVNQSFLKVVENRQAEHRLVAHIPKGKLIWNMPLYAEQIPWGITPRHMIHGWHYDWQVRANGAKVIVEGSKGVSLATKTFGSGRLIYHASMQPLLGIGGADSGMYAYMIYRNAIEWAFEAARLPILKVSPWRYAYDSAFIIRHDLENTAGEVIEASAKAEAAVGAKGDYYFCTGVLRENLRDNPKIIESLRRAVTLYGATIGPHNGGLKNPNTTDLQNWDFQYWHWGPDEALDASPRGYASGKEYALKSMTLAYADIERWLKGVDNGRPGCGAAGNCPRIWVSPYFNSGREDSYDLLDQLSVTTAGEQKLSPFPHFTISTRTEGLIYPQLTLPVSEWYLGSAVAQSIEAGHTVPTIRALVDFYSEMGLLVNLYNHASSAAGLPYEYMTYVVKKPRMWATNSIEIYDWWMRRAKVTVQPVFETSGDAATVRAAVRGAVDPETAVELVMPNWNKAKLSAVEVRLNGALVDYSFYRLTRDGLKIKVGAGDTEVEVRYPVNEALTLPEPLQWIQHFIRTRLFAE